MRSPFVCSNSPCGARGGYCLIVLLALATFASCGRSDRVAVYRVEGTVRRQGKAAIRALVVFHPQDQTKQLQNLRPAGTVDAKGRFSLSTYEPNDGAPAGEYRVTVVWAGKGEGGHPGPDRLGGQYANPKKTPLKATVLAGENHLEPIDL